MKKTECQKERLVHVCEVITYETEPGCKQCTGTRSPGFQSQTCHYLCDPAWAPLPARAFLFSSSKWRDGARRCLSLLLTLRSFSLWPFILQKNRRKRRKKEQKRQLVLSVSFFSCFSVDNSRNDLTNWKNISEQKKYPTSPNAQWSHGSPGQDSHLTLFSEVLAHLNQPVLLQLLCLLNTKKGELKRPCVQSKSKSSPLNCVHLHYFEVILTERCRDLLFIGRGCQLLSFKPFAHGTRLTSGRLEAWVNM